MHRDMNTTDTATHPTLTAGIRVGIYSGCKARQINKGDGALVLSIENYERGVVRVRLQFAGDRVISFFCHGNRLSDAFPVMHTGNPTHKITITRVRYGTVRVRA